MRVKFKFDKDRGLFFDLVRESFESWKEVCMFLGVNRNTLWKYRNGEYLMPLLIFNILKKHSDLEHLGSKISFYEDNWGRKVK